MNSNIGKFKRFLKDRCPICNCILEIRVFEDGTLVKGVMCTTPYEYIICSNLTCGYEKNIEQRRRKHLETPS